MGTTFTEILTQFAMQEIDDINWTRGLQENPAAFLRAKSDTLISAIPRFTRPAEAQSWLTFTPPSYDSWLYTAAESQTAPIELETGITGMELCSGTMIGTSNSAHETYMPIDVDYDSETGKVTLNIDLAAGAQVDLDFYTDGVFTNDLDVEQKQILGLCCAVQWYSRFANTWLNLQPKIKDKSFDVGSESAHITAATAKYKEMRLALNDKLLRYEENVYYRQRYPAWRQLQSPT